MNSYRLMKFQTLKNRPKFVCSHGGFIAETVTLCSNCNLWYINHSWWHLYHFMITIVLMTVGLSGLAKILININSNLTCCFIVAHKIFNCGIQIKSKILLTYPWVHIYILCTLWSRWVWYEMTWKHAIAAQ